MRRAALLVAALCGCSAASGPATLHFGMLEPPPGEGVVFPAPPEVPRFMYAGELTGERNFHRQGEGSRAALGRLFALVTGLASADAPRVELQRPVSGMTDAAGRVFVTDMSRQAVFVFDPVAGALKVWDRAYGVHGFAAPVGIAAGRDGEVLVADAGLGLVVRLAADGEPKGTFGKGVLKRPTGIARDAASGRIFVCDTYAHDVKVFDDDGRLVRTIGRRGEGRGEFNYPTHLALARGELYVTDSMNRRVQVFAADAGTPERQLGAPGLYVGNLVRPKGVALDAEGNVYVIESYYDRLLVFDGKGEFLMPLGATGYGTGRFYLPQGVWVDTHDRVYVADMFNGRVAVFQLLEAR